MQCELRFLGFFLVLFIFGTPLGFAQTKVKVGILSFESKPETASRWQPTANYLQSTVPDTRFEIVPLGYEELNSAIKSGAVDFVFTNPEHYVVLRNVFRLSPMVTLNTLIENQGSTQFGGVIFTKRSSAIQNIPDIKGKRVAAVGLYSLGGFLAAADILRKFGINLRSSDVKSLDFVGTPHSKVVQQVMGGGADVGLVRTGILEQMAAQGKLDIDTVRVLNLQPASVYPLVLSTDLFPEWPFAAMPNANLALIKAVTVALLKIQPDSSYAHAGRYFGFSPPANYAPVEELMRRLKVYPNVESLPLWKELWLEYDNEIEIAGVFFVLLMIGVSGYMWMGNRRLRKLTHLYKDAQKGLKITAAAFESQIGIVVTDEQTRIVRANAAFSQLFGYAEPDVLGKSTALLRSLATENGTLREIWPLLHAEGHWQAEMQCQHQDGHDIPCVVAITALHDDTGKLTGFVGSFLDISAQKNAQLEMRQLALFDPLTELPNRRLFIEHLTEALKDAVAEQYFGALMFIDLDNFKVLNDTHGHTVGDALLQLLAHRLSSVAGPDAFAARLGGDEFVVMLPNVHHDVAEATEKATKLALKVRRSILTAFELKSMGSVNNDLLYNISGSIGVALFGNHDESVVEVLKRADVAMYQAKMAGKDTVRVFDPSVQISLAKRVALSAELSAALFRGQLAIHYQIQTTESGRAVGAECLLRWKHAERGMVPPTEFIALAEESGAILGIGEWVILQACQTLARWQDIDHCHDLTLSVNVSPRQFTEVDFEARIESILAQSGIDPHKLCLEITEGIVFQDSDQIIEKMHRLCAMGVSFSIDDFGTGYSSLSYLQRLPLREIKIDKAFVTNLVNDPASEAIVKAIVALGSSMNIGVLAEGVETEAQRLHLANLGCHLMQGYLFGKPMDLATFETHLPA